MSPFMFLIVLAILAGVLVFLVGIFKRNKKLILIGSPAALLFISWMILASLRPNPEKEFDRIFGAANRSVASDIRTQKPTFMHGHFISFSMNSVDFDTRIYPQFSATDSYTPGRILLRQQLPNGWPAAIETTNSVLHSIVQNCDVYLIYFPKEEKAYASVQYDQW